MISLDFSDSSNAEPKRRKRRGNFNVNAQSARRRRRSASGRLGSRSHSFPSPRLSPRRRIRSDPIIPWRGMPNRRGGNDASTPVRQINFPALPPSPYISPIRGENEREFFRELMEDIEEEQRAEFVREFVRDFNEVRVDWGFNSWPYSEGSFYDESFNWNNVPNWGEPEWVSLDSGNSTEYDEEDSNPVLEEIEEDGDPELMRNSFDEDVPVPRLFARNNQPPSSPSYARSLRRLFNEDPSTPNYSDELRNLFDESSAAKLRRRLFS